MRPSDGDFDAGLPRDYDGRPVGEAFGFTLSPRASARSVWVSMPAHMQSDLLRLTRPFPSFHLQISVLAISPAFSAAANYLILGQLISRLGQRFSRLNVKTYAVSALGIISPISVATDAR